jgi:DNA-binding transcriptional ArsR family regulator
MTLTKKAKAGRPILSKGPLSDQQLREQLAPEVQTLRRLALAVLTKDWRPLGELRTAVATSADPWRDLRDAGLAERSDEGDRVRYRLAQPRRRTKGGK